MTQTVHRIGEWRFDAECALLLSEGQSRALEHRAARTLELLCVNRGHVVSHAEIINDVWSGRTVSPNSLAVVISDLRRALGEHTRHPVHIVTVPKRGYRLNPNTTDELLPTVDDVQDLTAVEATQVGSIRPLGWFAAAAGALLILGATAMIWIAPPAPSLTFRPVTNDTGLVRYDRTVRALNELVRLRLSRMGAYRVIEVRPGVAVLGPVLTSKLILWNGQPTLSLSIADAEHVTWAAMAEGPEPALAHDTLARLDEFAAMKPNR